MNRRRTALGIASTTARAAGISLLAAGMAGAGTPPRMTDLGGVAGFSTAARGINDAGVIVGDRMRTLSETQREGHGLLWRKDASGAYSWIEVGTLPDFPNSYPRSINNAGRIAGWAETADLTVGPPAQAVMWEPGPGGDYPPVDLGTPYGFWYSETASFNQGGHVINRSGQIVGGGSLPSWQYHPQLWANPGVAPPTDLSPTAPAGTYFIAYGVNNAGIAVGEGRTSGAVLWTRDESGGYVQADLPMPDGGTRATAWDVNDDALIVGMVDNRAAIWEPVGPAGYEPAYLEVPAGSGYGRALALSDSGDLVGWATVVAEDGSVRAHAMLWRRDGSGQFVPDDLGVLPGFTSSRAFGVNERGQIVGSSERVDAETGTLESHAVLWEVGDAEPPVIGHVSADPSTLWPPNHGLVAVRIQYDAQDDGGYVSCHLGPVTCNEPLGSADWRVGDDHSVELRAERLGGGTGRVYRVTIACVDPAGNTASEQVEVVVPHDQRRR